MKESIISNKSYEFAVKIVLIVQALCDSKREFVLSQKLCAKREPTYTKTVMKTSLTVTHKLLTYNF